MENNSHFALNCLDSISLFNALTSEQRTLVFKLIRHSSYKAGERIYSPGQPANSIHIISQGKVRIFRLAESGREQLIRLLVPGEFAGELALFKEGIYEAYAESITDTKICMIFYEDFKALLKSYPSISIAMLATLAARLSVSEQQSTWMSTETAKQRLLHYLVRSATRDTHKNLIVHLPMAKKDLASYLGTTPETFSRQWTKLKKEGIIQSLYRNTVKLVDANFEISEF